MWHYTDGCALDAVALYVIDLDVIDLDVIARAPLAADPMADPEDDCMPKLGDIRGDTRLALSEAALSTAIPGEIVILDPESGQYYGLDGVGARAWELLEPTSTLDELVRTISAEYEVDARTCEHDLRELLHDLGARGLVVAVDRGGG